MKDIESRKERWRSFLQPAAEQGFQFYVRFNDPAANLPPAQPPWPERQAERVEHIWAAYQHSVEQAAWLEDDSVPSLNMMTGTEIFAESFGCKVHKPTDSNPFALPLIHSASEVAALAVPDLSTSTLAYLFDMADELQRRAGPDAVFHLVDVQSPMDIAALIWEKSSFFMAILEEPEAVKELAAKVYQFQTAFLDEWFGRYGTEFVAHYPDYFMSGGMTLSEDEAGSVNAEIFEDLFLPELAALSKRYGGIGMHCCADARHQWANFKKIPGLRLLNLNNPPARDPDTYVSLAYDFFADHCVQWHYGWAPPGSLSDQARGFAPGSRVVLEAAANSREEARRLCEEMQALRSASST